MNKRPYKNNNLDYIYSLECERIIIFPIGIIYNLLDMWEIIIEGVEKKLTFHQVKKNLAEQSLKSFVMLNQSEVESFIE